MVLVCLSPLDTSRLSHSRKSPLAHTATLQHYNSAEHMHKAFTHLYGMLPWQGLHTDESHMEMIRLKFDDVSCTDFAHSLL